MSDAELAQELKDALKAFHVALVKARNARLTVTIDNRIVNVRHTEGNVTRIESIPAPQIIEITRDYA